MWMPVNTPDTPVIDSFSGPHRFLSNFYPCEVFFEGIEFHSLECAYQAAKSDDMQIRRGFALLRNPGSARRLGKQIPLRANWDKIKFGIMRALIRTKFSPKTTLLASHLVDTYPAYLIEGNTWGDTYWGACFADGQWKGLNNLGYLLMECRDILMRA